MQSIKVTEEHDHTRLDVFLTKNLSEVPSRSFVKKLIDHGHVKVNELPVKAHHKVLTGEEVLVNIPDDFLAPQYVEPENIPLDIFYEDEALLVVNKPSGLLVHPAIGVNKGTLVNALLYHKKQLSNFNGSTPFSRSPQASDMRPGIVHRLDQETSGLILIAKDNITHTKLAKQFQRKLVKKSYVARVEGLVEFDEGKIDAPIGRHPRHRDKKTVLFDDSAKESVTVYRVLKRFKNSTLIRLYPKTGRTHQLRVHMKYLGHPILGDDKYGKKSTFSRLALHAQSIGFSHPSTKKFVEFSSKMPQLFLKEAV